MGRLSEQLNKGGRLAEAQKSKLATLVAGKKAEEFLAKPWYKQITSPDISFTEDQKGAGFATGMGKSILEAPQAFSSLGAFIGSKLTGKKVEPFRAIPEQVLERKTTEEKAGYGAGVAAQILAPTKAVGLVRGADVVQKTLRAKIIGSMRNNVEDLIKSKKSIENKVIGLEEQSVPIREMLSEQPIFNGLKVEKGTINPDKAISIVEERIDRGMKVTKDLLPEMDKYIPDVSRGALRQKAYSNATKQGLLAADEEDILLAIDKQINAFPEKLKPSQIDSIRAKARNSSRTAKGQLKRSNEYAAIEGAARDLVFESADALPTATKGQFAQLRNYIKQNIDLQTFLDETLRGQKVKGGRLGVYAGRGLGAIAGAQGGVFTAILGAEAGGKVAGILMNNQLGSSIKMKMIKDISNNPKILTEAEKFLGIQKGYKPLQLPAATSPLRSEQIGAKQINLPTKSTTTLEAEEIARIKRGKLLNP